MDFSCLISRTALVRTRMPGGVRGALCEERSYLNIISFLLLISINTGKSH